MSDSYSFSRLPSGSVGAWCVACGSELKSDELALFEVGGVEQVPIDGRCVCFDCVVESSRQWLVESRGNEGRG